MQYSYVSYILVIYLVCFRVVVSLVREIPMALRVLNLRELHVLPCKKMQIMQIA